MWLACDETRSILAGIAFACLFADKSKHHQIAMSRRTPWAHRYSGSLVDTRKVPMLDPSPREIFATRVMLAASKGKRGMGVSSFPDSDVGHVLLHSLLQPLFPSLDRQS